MKRILVTLIVLGVCTYAHAESKTEIVVKKGIVKTTTDQGDSLIRRGQKAILEDGKQPAVSLNNEIVQKMLQLQQKIELERKEQPQIFKSSLVQSISIEGDNLWKIGAILTLSNKTDHLTNEFRMGPTSAVKEVSFFTLEGLPIRYKMEQIDENKAYYYLYSDRQVEPQQDFTFLMLTDLSEKTPVLNALKEQALTKENGQWRLWTQNDTANCLNYMHYVLPKGAVFVKSDPAAETIEEQDGRVSITIRKLTGSEAKAPFYIYFLWPEKDGTCLKGIPWTNAGPEAVEIYELFLTEDIQSPELWGELAIKLVGGGFYDEAYDAFERCYNGHTSSVWDCTALAWQGHLHDLWGQREEAIAKYEQALKIKPNSNMRHDQWSIILTQQWLENRLQEPFTENMFVVLAEGKKGIIERFGKLPWKDGGEEVLRFYQDLLQSGIEEVQGWVLIGIKLVGAGYFDEAMDCFQRAETGGSTHSYLFAALVWQGHLLDIQGQRQQAIEKYYQALEMEDDEVGKMRHDQWGIVLTKDWVRQRLESPFAIDMLK